jgi:hypothetical protein
LTYSTTQPGVLDDDGYTICPDCLTRVNCGTVGIANLERRHRGKKVCLENKKKREKEELQNQRIKKNASILNFFGKPKAANVPSTVSSPAPIHSNKLAPEAAAETISITSPPSPSQDEISPSAFVSDPSSSGLLERFQYLINNLPETVPNAPNDDRLAIFDASLSTFDDMTIGSEDLWEEIINNILKSALGWGMEGNMDEIISQGRNRLGKLVNFMRYFIVERGVDETLFEGKLTQLMSALETR